MLEVLKLYSSYTGRWPMAQLLTKDPMFHPKAQIPSLLPGTESVKENRVGQNFGRKFLCGSNRLN